MGQLKRERLTLMPEECKVDMREQKRRSLERQAKKTKRLADNVTNVDENEDDEENEEEEEEEEEEEKEEEDEDDDGSENEACTGISREDSDKEEDERLCSEKPTQTDILTTDRLFAFQWTNEPRSLNPGSVREYDCRAYSRVSPTTQPRGKGERSTKISSPEGSANMPVLGSWCCGKADCKIHENSSRKFQESNKFWPIQGKIVRMMHRSRLPTDD
ncbi:hypothetical protein BOTCAL_0074g00050 [Botryotinia calthae]|uniref:Uncharacterized protein n=1 Tax=Botryotinia calthae TaxID=38488 RepID=A0A4Y8D923_9HELO|nr:hypothetical protein BOTCAL_0074g00050 [Botryotinia calthae]